MTRYRKAILNELEFDVDGTKVMIRPTLEDKFEALQMLKEFQQKGDADLKKLKDYMTKLIFNALPETEQNEVDAKKETENFVVENILKIWIEIQVGFKFASREEVEKRLKGDSAAEKK